MIQFPNWQIYDIHNKEKHERTKKNCSCSQSKKRMMELNKNDNQNVQFTKQTIRWITVYPSEVNPYKREKISYVKRISVINTANPNICREIVQQP